MCNIESQLTSNGVAGIESKHDVQLVRIPSHDALGGQYLEATSEKQNSAVTKSIYMLAKDFFYIIPFNYYYYLAMTIGINVLCQWYSQRKGTQIYNFSLKQQL